MATEDFTSTSDLNSARAVSESIFDLGHHLGLIARPVRPQAETSGSPALVLPIRRKTSRPADCDRALALLEEARDLLDGLVERGEVEPGSPPDMAGGYLDDAIGMLKPFEDEEGTTHG